MKRTRIRALFILFAAALFISPPQAIAASKVGDKAPDFSAKTLDGKAVALGDYLGKKPVYLVFWATWCPNCLQEVPAINALHTKFGDRLAILAINVGINDSADAAREYQKKHGMKYPVVFDDGSAVSSAYGIVGTPTQILIGTDGIIRYRGSKTPAATDIETRWKKLSGG